MNTQNITVPKEGLKLPGVDQLSKLLGPPGGVADAKSNRPIGNYATCDMLDVLRKQFDWKLEQERNYQQELFKKFREGQGKDSLGKVPILESVTEEITILRRELTEEKEGRKKNEQSYLQSSAKLTEEIMKLNQKVVSLEERIQKTGMAKVVAFPIKLTDTFLQKDKLNDIASLICGLFKQEMNIRLFSPLKTNTKTKDDSKDGLNYDGELPPPPPSPLSAEQIPMVPNSAPTPTLVLPPPIATSSADNDMIVNSPKRHFERNSKAVLVSSHVGNTEEAKTPSSKSTSNSTLKVTLCTVASQSASRNVIPQQLQPPLIPDAKIKLEPISENSSPSPKSSPSHSDANSTTGTQQRHGKDLSRPRSQSFCLCGSKFSSNMALVQHLKQHNQIMGKSLHCKLCGKKFPLAVQLRGHLMKAHKTTKNAIGSSKSHSSMKFRNGAGALGETKFIPDTSMISKRPNNGNREKAHGAAVPAIDENGLTRFCCKCGNHYSERRGLLYHIKVATSGFAYKCTPCNKLFSAIPSFRDHMRTQHQVEYGKGKFSCGSCGKLFENHRQLMRHRVVDHR